MPARSHLAAALVVVAAVATGCPWNPPADPTGPPLPANVAVRWFREQADVPSEFGNPDLSGDAHRVTSAGDSTLSTGTLFSAEPSSFIPMFAQAGGVPLTPSAPWNGFAPEGFTAVYVDANSDNAHWVVRPPDGGCDIDTRDTGSIQISPSGDRAAVVERYNPGGYGYVTVVDLTVAACTVLFTTASIDFMGGQAVSPLIVWSTDSTQVLYGLTTGFGFPDLHRVDVATGADDVVVTSSDACFGATGWSSADRLVLTCIDTATQTLSIRTQAVDGADEREILSVAPGAPPVPGFKVPFGYFVPGTTDLAIEETDPDAVPAGSGGNRLVLAPDEDDPTFTPLVTAVPSTRTNLNGETVGNNDRLVSFVHP